MHSISHLTRGIRSDQNKGELHLILIWKPKNGTGLNMTYKHKMKCKEFKVV